MKETSVTDTAQLVSVCIPFDEDSQLFPVGSARLRLKTTSPIKDLVNKRNPAGELDPIAKEIRRLLEDVAKAAFDAGCDYERNQAFVATVDVERMRAVLDEFKHSG